QEMQTAAASQSPAAGEQADLKAQARELLNQAKADLKAGRVVEARRKAMEADQFNVVYNLFEEKPSDVLGAIARSSRSTGGQLGGGDEPRALGPVAAERQAAELARQARADIEAGNLVDGQVKAEQARKLNVTYGLLEDRPEIVLADIQQLVQSRSAGPK